MVRPRTYDICKLYDSPEAFFQQVGVTSMRLSRSPASAACDLALSHGLMICRIEGGIWRPPAIEARLDCIWDGLDPPVDAAQAQANNELAKSYIEHQPNDYDVYILTSTPLAGWWSKGFVPSPIVY